MGADAKLLQAETLQDETRLIPAADSGADMGATYTRKRHSLTLAIHHIRPSLLGNSVAIHHLNA